MIKLAIIHVIMIATIMISSQYVTALQALTQSHRDLVRRDVIEMDLPNFEAEAEQNNSTFLDMGAAMISTLPTKPKKHLSLRFSLSLHRFLA